MGLSALLDRSTNGEKLRRDFFREEYKLNYLSGNYRLPYVAIINGITMGGVRNGSSERERISAFIRRVAGCRCMGLFALLRKQRRLPCLRRRSVTSRQSGRQEQLVTKFLVGLFPDVGGAHFLPRLSNNLGVFLGLTGHRLRGTDVLHAGIATHYVPSSKVDQFPITEDEMIYSSL